MEISTANYNTLVQTAKAGIWYRAQRTANPKGTILKTQPMAGSKLAIRAYNEALVAAKAWARAPKPVEVKIDYTTKTVKELKAALKTLGLKVSGNKAALVERMTTA